MTVRVRELQHVLPGLSGSCSAPSCRKRAVLTMTTVSDGGVSRRRRWCAVHALPYLQSCSDGARCRGTVEGGAPRCRRCGASPPELHDPSLAGETAPLAVLRTERRSDPPWSWRRRVNALAAILGRSPNRVERHLFLRRTAELILEDST